jgi:hypothetical protein
VSVQAIAAPSFAMTLRRTPSNGSKVNDCDNLPMSVACIAALTRRRSIDMEMTMKFRVLSASVVFIGLTSATALAQNNLGELLDMGGKKLSKEELVATLSAANLSGETREGSSYQSDYKADGTFAGSFVSPQKRNGTSYGTWAVDDTGKVCTDGTIRLYEVRQQKTCVYHFKNGDQYYISPSDSDRGAFVLKRTIKK